jgi:hypothetical protein
MWELSMRERSILEDRDRIWCFALLGVLKIDETHAVLKRYRDLLERQDEVLDTLRKGLEPHVQ